MALVNGTIPSMYNGVSQQSPAVRHENQCENLVNGYPTVVRGLSMRPPAEHVMKAVASPVDTKSFVHFIHRDKVEQYAVIVQPDKSIKVFDLLNAVEKTVTVSGTANNYLSTDPKNDLVALTVADYTFFVNKATQIAKGSSTASGTLGDAYTSLDEINSTNGIDPPSGEHEITGDGRTDLDSFYVQGDGEVWREIAKPGVDIEIDADTMPHQLIRNADGTFTFDVASWDNRKAGDDNSNDFPSFLGNSIDDIFFHRNRLGFTSDENVVMSEAGHFFNFFRTTVMTLLDSARIDATASHTKVSLLKHAVPYEKNLYLFSPQAQFVLDGGDLLTPNTVGIDQTTEYEVDVDVKPIASGNTLFFVTPGGAYSNVREYYLEEDVASNVAANVTAHVPKYIPSNVSRIASSSNYDVLFVLSDDDPNSLYVYKYYWKGNEKVQSAWSKWEFPSDVTILSMEAIENYLYVVMNRSSGTYIEKINLETFQETDTMGFTVYLDRLTTVTGSYDSNNNETTFSLPYEVSLSNDIRAVLSDDFTGQVGQLLDPSNYTRPDDHTLVVSGDYSGGKVYIGEPFTFLYEFSPQFARDRDGILLEGDLRLRYMEVYYTDTSYFKAKVTPFARNTQTTQWTETVETQYTGKTVGSDAFILGQPAFRSGSLRFPVMSAAESVKIELENDSHLGCHFSKAEWVGNLTKRSRRIG